MSQQDKNLSIVKEIYEAVGRGDVEAILDRVTDDIDWAAEAASSSAPWYGTRTGKTGVASFFGDLASSIEITEFTPHSFAAGEDNVHLLVEEAGELPGQTLGGSELAAQGAAQREVAGQGRAQAGHRALPGQGRASAARRPRPAFA